MCFSPQRRAIFQHLKSQLQKVVWDPQFFNILTWKCASRHSAIFQHLNFKVLRTLQFFNILTWKCASRHSGVQFFNISTSKSGPNMQCFVHFYLKMCFSPQRRAIFQHLNFKKWSENVSLLAFSLQNALLATAACNFWFLLWPHDSAPAALTSQLFDSPDTRIIGKNTAFRDFSNIPRGCIFFLPTFAPLHLPSSDSTSSSDFTFLWLYFICLLFICFSTLHIVGSLLFKLPSIISPHRFFAARQGNVVAIGSKNWNCRSKV